MKDSLDKEIKELRETFNPVEDRDFYAEVLNINRLREELIKKYKQRVSDRIFHDKLVAELKKVVDSSSDTT